MLICRWLLIFSILLVACWVVLVFRGLGIAVLIALLVASRTKWRSRRLTAFGTSRWADECDLDLNANGLAIGRLAVPARSLWAIFNPRISSADACMAFLGNRPRPMVRLPNVIHSAIFMPTGVGKGATFGIPHGLTCTDNSVYVDLNGEIATATIKARLAMGHRVVLLDPHHVVTDQPNTLNALDTILRDSATALDDCRALAEALVVRTGLEREPHWPDVAEENICATTAFVVQHAPPEDRSLLTVAGILADREEREAGIAVMRQSPAWHGILARMGNKLANFQEKEAASMLTTVGRYLRFLDSPAIAASTIRSDFDVSELLTGRMSIFLILPAEYLRVDVPLLRLWLSTLLSAVVKGGTQNRQRIHFVLDEAGSLGHLQCLDDALDKYRKFGVRLMFMYQSLGQLKTCWPEGRDQVLLANTTTLFAGVNDQPTAELVSSRLGDETILIESGGVSRGRTRQTPDYGNHGSTSYSVNSSENWQQGARRLLKPEEILGLNERVAITFTPGCPPIRTTLERYYEKGLSNKVSLRMRLKVYYCCVVMFLFAVMIILVAMGFNIHQLGK